MKKIYIFILIMLAVFLVGLIVDWIGWEIILETLLLILILLSASYHSKYVEESKRTAYLESQIEELKERLHQTEQSNWNEHCDYHTHTSEGLRQSIYNGVVYVQDCKKMYLGFSAEYLSDLIIQEISYTSIKGAMDIKIDDFEKNIKIALYAGLGLLSVYQSSSTNYDPYRITKENERILLTDEECDMMSRHNYDFIFDNKTDEELATMSEYDYDSALRHYDDETYEDCALDDDDFIWDDEDDT